MGVQTAEEMAFGDITTGASDEVKNASGVARKMVIEYGMSDELGPRTFGAGQDLVFLGKELAQGPNYSDAVAERIDAEIEGFLKRAQQTAKKVLEANRTKLTFLANRLLSEETIEGAEVLELLAGSPKEARLVAD